MQFQATIIGTAIKTHEQCTAEAKLTVDDIKQVFQLNIKQPVKCYLKCFLAKEGFWKNGAVDGEKIHQLISQFKPLQQYEKQIDSILQQCKNVQGKDECDKAFSASKCLIIHGLKVVGGVIAGVLFQILIVVKLIIPNFV